MRIEDLKGIKGVFEGEVRVVTLSYAGRVLEKVLADGEVTYTRTVQGEQVAITTKVNKVAVRRLRMTDDFRRYIRITRGSKTNRDTIIGIIDKET